MKTVVLDYAKTLGTLNYLGCDPVVEYKDGKRTDNIIGYNYNLASSVQESQVVVKVMGDKKEFKMLQAVKLIGPSCNIYAKPNGKYANVIYNLSAEDIANG